MLPFFPTPYPDELFYSICARYHKRSANISIKATVKDLFGSASVCAVADFPTHFDYLCGLLPEGTLNTADRLIYGHTMLPLYRLFLPKVREKNLVAWMKGSTRGNSIHVAIGAVSSCIPLPGFFRYCRECVVDDEAQFGEPYWHRCHQVMGVRVCHKHHAWLFESNIATSVQRNKQMFFVVPGHSQLERGRTLRDDDGHLEFYRSIAESVAWLLQSDNIRLPGLHSLQRWYLIQLHRLGLTTSSGRVVQRELIARFVDHFGTYLLEQMHCRIDRYSQNSWLSTLVRKPRKSAHPIRHILLIHFLGLKINDFFKMEHRQDLPFGRGPWPCLNPVASHYRQPVVRNCVITRNGETRGPVGNFYCTCGFAYARTGPDEEKDDHYRRGRIIAFGTEWERELIRLAVKERKGLRPTARALGVDTNTVKKHLSRLTRVNYKEPDSKNSKVREARRANWLLLRSEHVEKGRKELHDLSPADYKWLYRNDFEWLRKNLPMAKVKVLKTLQRVDWVKRDCLLASRIMFAVRRIMGLPGRPIRVTTRSVGRTINERSILEKKLTKLPITKIALDMLVESKEAFDVRRVRYAAAMLSEKCESLSVWRIEREARLRPGYSMKVSDEIEHLIDQGSGTQMLKPLTMCTEKNGFDRYPLSCSLPVRESR